MPESVPAPGFITGLALQADGKILVGGNFSNLSARHAAASDA